MARDHKRSSGPRYVELPGEDSVFGDIYGGSEAYVKFDILPVEEAQYHYPNLDTAMKGPLRSIIRLVKKHWRLLEVTLGLNMILNEEEKYEKIKLFETEFSDLYITLG